mmetsp:Transcript_8475/g.19843  ORF Transcript_8475/g.19843 Transcript_8475/m.19843 type:complete len:207 (-) Transcript_8475:267-887(-)
MVLGEHEAARLPRCQKLLFTRLLRALLYHPLVKQGRMLPNSKRFLAGIVGLYFLGDLRLQLLAIAHEVRVAEVDARHLHLKQRAHQLLGRFEQLIELVQNRPLNLVDERWQVRKAGYIHCLCCRHKLLVNTVDELQAKTFELLNMQDDKHSERCIDVEELPSEASVLNNQAVHLLWVDVINNFHSVHCIRESILKHGLDERAASQL